MLAVHIVASMRARTKWSANHLTTVSRKTRGDVNRAQVSIKLIVTQVGLIAEWTKPLKG